MRRDKGQSPLQIHRVTSDDEGKAVPLNDWGSIFDKEEVKSAGYEGYLSKKAQKMGGLPSRWVRRYFIFDEEKSMLMYWGNKTETQKIKPRGSYLATDFLTVLTPDPARPSRFDVKLKDKYGDRLLCLRADKEYEARQWVESIRKHVAMEVAKAQSAEEKEFVGEWTAGKTIEMMNKGQKMVAYFANGDRRAVKLFCRSLCLYVCHINGTPNSPILQIPLRSVTDIYVGKQTPGFGTGVAADIPADKCFSVKSKQYTVDVEAATTHQTLGWLKGLQYLLTNSGTSVLYEEEVAAGGAAPAEGGGAGPGAGAVGEKEGEDDMQTPKKPMNKGGEGEDSQPPALTPASDDKSGNSKKRKVTKTPASPSSPGPASPGPAALDRSPLSGRASDSEDDERKRLMDRLQSAEKERDALRSRVDSMAQSGEGGPRKGDDYTLPAKVILPSLVSLLERYRVLTQEELPQTITAYSAVLASQKGKKNSKRHYRKAGTTITKAMEDCWKRTTQFLTGLVSRAVATVDKTEFQEGKNSLSSDLKEKHVMKVFMQFMGFLDPELHPFPANTIANDVLSGIGKFNGFADAERVVREFLSHTLQLWWAFILVPNNECKPVWKEELGSDYYTLISDLNVKDGSIRFPPLVDGEGRVVYKGEARPLRKDKGNKKK